MKKIYNLLLLIIPFVGQAQTITQADLPSAGIFWTVATDANHTAAIPAGGAGVTWDYSGLGNTGTDTSGFIDAVGTPYASSYPNSNLAAMDPASMMYTYFTSSATGFYADGSTDGSSNLAYTPSLLYIPVPFTLNDSRNNTSVIQIDTVISGQTLRLRLIFNHQFTCDGSGTLITPTGTYNNVIRIKVTEANTDSVYISAGPLGWQPFSGSTTQTTSYRYVTSGLVVNYILGVEADSLGTTATSAEYFLAQVPVGVSTISKNEVSKAYPNPASGTVNFTRFDEGTEVVIFNSNGAEVMRSKENSLNVENLAPGIYHYNLKLDGTINEGTFMIQR